MTDLQEERPATVVAPHSSSNQHPSTRANPQHRQHQSVLGMCVGFVFGIPLGLVVGALMGSIAAGLAICITLGLVVGMLVDRRAAHGHGHG